MSQEYQVGGNTYRVEIGSGEEGLWEVSISRVPEEGGEEIEAGKFSARVSWVAADTYSLSIDGRNYLGHLASGPEGEEIFIGGETHLVIPPDKLSRRRGAAAQGAAQHVTPPMPGVVIKILAEVGQRVEEGEGVIVVSAMKMETTLAAPRSGVVTKINTEVDARVKPGDILIEVEEEGAAGEE